MKKLIALVMSAIFYSVLFCSFSAYAALSADTVIYSNDGGTDIPFPAASGLTKTITSSPIFKPSGDSALKISGTSTVNTTGDTSGRNYLNLQVSNKIGEVKTYKKITVRFDVLLTEDGTAVAFRGGQKDSTSSPTTYFKLYCGKDFLKNTWNTVAFVIGADGNDNTYTVYLNGAEYKKGYTENGAYGFTKTGWITTHCDKDENFGMYIDNVEILGGNDGYLPCRTPFITNCTGGFELSGSKISVPAGSAAGELLTALETDSTQNEVHIYDADGAAVSDGSFLKNGDVVSVKNTDGIYAYYSIKAAEKNLFAADGSAALKFSAGTSGLKFSSAYSDAPLKSESDSVYRMYGTAASNLSTDWHGQGYVNLDLGTLIGNTKKYGVITLSFDFCLLNDGNGVSFRGAMAKDESTAAASQTFFKITAGKDAETGRWYKLTLSIDADGTGGKYRVYLNDKLYAEKALTAGTYGFAKTGWIMPHANQGEAFEMLLDNINVYGGSDEYLKNRAAVITGFNNGFTADNGINRIYGISADTSADYVINNANLSSDDARLYVTSESFEIVSGEAWVSPVYYVVVLSGDGIYTYYSMSAEKDCEYTRNVVSASNGSVYAAKIGAKYELYYINADDADITVDFNRNTVLPSSVVKENVSLVSDTGEAVSYTLEPIASGSFASGVKIHASGLQKGEKYFITIKNITAKKSSGNSTEYKMAGEQKLVFATAPLNDGTDVYTANIPNNTVGSIGWSGRGGLKSFDEFYDSDKGKNVIRAYGRTKYYEGIIQEISYEDFYAYTKVLPGAKSDYRLSFGIKSDMADTSDEEMIISMSWYNDGTEKYVYAKKIPAAEIAQKGWIYFDETISFTVPAAVSAANSAYLRIHIESDKTSTSFGTFYISDFSLKKPYGGNKINLEIDENQIVRKIDNSLLGYAIEGGNWSSDYYGAVVYKNSNQWKPEFLELAAKLGLKTIRFGGYTTNYEFWKCSLGDTENRIPVYAPSPAWDTSKPYWRNGIEYIGPMERLQLAETFNKDASVIMCVNMWSYLPDIDYGKKYTTPITPAQIVKTDSSNVKYIDYSALKTATDDIIDFIRFCTLMPDDERAVGSDGINWAQRRTELGHAEPYNIDIWELGNELYHRGINGSLYVNMCKYMIPLIREVFPDVKLAVHIDATGNSSNWREYVIKNLADKTDYIAIHSYYSYSTVNGAVNNIKTVQSLIGESANPNVKCILTEGGLDNFKNYTGPSNQSVIMSTAFADFINRISTLDKVESFQYFGSGVQICYNDENSVKPGWDYSADLTAEELCGDGQYVKISQRTDFAQGVWQDIAYSDFKAIGQNAGQSADYDISLDLKFDGAADSGEEFILKLEWLSDGTVADEVYSRIIKPSDYVRGSWLHISEVIKNITVPSSFTGTKRESFRITINGNNSAKAASDIYLRNIEFTKAGTDNNLASGRLTDKSGFAFRPTALSETMKYYLDNIGGSMVYTNNRSSITTGRVSAMAVKTDSGIRLFLANTDESTDYTVTLSTSDSYSLAEKYLMYSDSLYAERNETANDIYTVRESYSSNKPINTVAVPKSSVLVLELINNAYAENSIFADKVTVSGKTVRLDCNFDKECSVIAAFYDADGNLTDSKIRSVPGGETEAVFASDTKYDKIKLFKWSLNGVVPLANSEEYYSIIN